MNGTTLLPSVLARVVHGLMSFDICRDPKFREYLCQLNARKPVILTGDLNVGHLDLDIHNPTAKHIVKQAGLTPEERQSFTTFVTGPFRDAFRHFYPGMHPFCVTLY